MHMKSPRDQGLLFLIGFAVLIISLLVLYSRAPVEIPGESKWKYFYDFASYGLPCLAATCAGLGLFLNSPHQGQISAAGAGKVDDRGFFLISIGVLYLGLLAYAKCHPCWWPALVLIVSSFAWVAIFVLFWRTGGAGARRTLWQIVRHFPIDLILCLGLLALIYAWIHFGIFFKEGVCIG